MKPLKWIGTGLGALALVVIVCDIKFTRRLGPTNSDETVHRARDVLIACGAYRDSPANTQRGKYPATLADLHRPPFGGSTFLPDGEFNLIDAWGNPYRYAVMTNATGEQEVYVWSERVVNGKLKLLGAKRSADGTTELFGRDG